MGIISAMISVFDNLFPVTFQVNNFEISEIQLTLGITLSPVFYIVYFIIFDVVAGGQSAGKSISGNVVLLKTGEALNTRKHLLRSLYKMWSVLMLPVAVLLFVLDDYTIQDYLPVREQSGAGKMLNKS